MPDSKIPQNSSHILLLIVHSLVVYEKFTDKIQVNFGTKSSFRISSRTSTITTGYESYPLHRMIPFTLTNFSSTVFIFFGIFLSYFSSRNNQDTQLKDECRFFMVTIFPI